MSTESLLNFIWQKKFFVFYKPSNLWPIHSTHLTNYKCSFLSEQSVFWTLDPLPVIVQLFHGSLCYGMFIFATQNKIEKQCIFQQIWQILNLKKKVLRIESCGPAGEAATWDSRLPVKVPGSSLATLFSNPASNECTQEAMSDGCKGDLPSTWETWIEFLIPWI